MLIFIRKLCYIFFLFLIISGRIDSFKRDNWFLYWNKLNIWYLNQFYERIEFILWCQLHGRYTRRIDSPLLFEWAEQIEQHSNWFYVVVENIFSPLILQQKSILVFHRRWSTTWWSHHKRGGARRKPWSSRRRPHKLMRLGL